MAGARLTLARPVPDESECLIAVVVGVLSLVGGFGGVIIDVLQPDHFSNPVLLAAAAVGGIMSGGWAVALGLSDSRFLHREFARLAYIAMVVYPGVITLAQYAAGPVTLVATVMYVEVPIFAFYLLSTPRAVAVVSLIGLEFGFVLVGQGGYPAPGAEWSFLIVTLFLLGAVFGGLLDRAVGEAARLGELQRFLAPQVAAAILSTGSEEMLRPHRRKIAVLFCDLRGFTGFSAGAEPEEIVDLLDEYYRTVGEVLRTHEATVGNFAGDGIMAYFNDPVQVPDPAGDAVHAATALRGPLEQLSAAWRQKGFDLGWGIGIAFGYATLGTIGFEGRNDYTALGSVVNLAARLCAEASTGEILMDARSHEAVQGRVRAKSRDAQLKGFAGPIPVFCLAQNAFPAPSADSLAD